MVRMSFTSILEMQNRLNSSHQVSPPGESLHRPFPCRSQRVSLPSADWSLRSGLWRAQGGCRRGGKRYKARRSESCWEATRHLLAWRTWGPGEKGRGQQGKGGGGSHPLTVRARAALCFPVGVEKLKKEGAHPDWGESRRARAWCGDTGPGWRGGATSYCAMWWNRNRLPARFHWNRCRSCWERGL